MRELVPVGDESEHKLCIQDIKRRMAEISLIPRVLMALKERMLGTQTRHTDNKFVKLIMQ